MFKKIVTSFIIGATLMVSMAANAMVWNRKIETNSNTPMVHSLAIDDNGIIGFSFSCSVNSFPVVLFMFHNPDITPDTYNMVHMRFNGEHVVKVPFIPDHRAMVYNLKMNNGVENFFKLVNVMDSSDTIEVIIETPSGVKYGVFTAYEVKENLLWVHSTCKQLR